MAAVCRSFRPLATSFARFRRFSGRLAVAERPLEYSAVRWASTQPHSLIESLQQSVADHRDLPAFGTKGADDPAFVWMPYGDFYSKVQQFSSGMVARGVKPGDRVAIISRNSWQWAATAYAAYALGAVVVPMYEAQKLHEWLYIVGDSTPTMTFVSTEAVKIKLLTAEDVFPDANRIVVLDESSPSYQRFRVDARVAVERKLPHPKPPSPDDLATIIYTSGTTGLPKGVRLTHRNIMSNVNGLEELYGSALGVGDRSCQFLPFAHIFGQTIELHFALRMGMGIGFAQSADKLLANMKELQPSMLVSVPLVIYRIHDGIRAAVDNGSAVQKAVFNLAMQVAQWRRKTLNAGSNNVLPRLAYAIADAVVFSRIRDRFGGSLKLIIAGGAPTNRDVQRFLDDMGMVVLEGYGATETSPVVAAEKLAPTETLQGGLRRFPGTQLLLLSPDGDVVPSDGSSLGELCVAGPQVFQGYHNAPELTEAAFYKHTDGTKFFRTGDLATLGTVLDEEVITIKGRAKENFKLESGKFVRPAAVEDVLKTSALIDQAFVCGNGRHHPVALLVPDLDALRAWHEARNVPYAVDTSLPAVPRNNTQLFDLMQSEMDTALARAGSDDVKAYEVPAVFAILTHKFSTEGGELTQKLSMKRQVIEEKYKDVLDELHARANA